jgi:hypothetical protein
MEGNMSVKAGGGGGGGGYKGRSNEIFLPEHQNLICFRAILKILNVIV